METTRISQPICEKPSHGLVLLVFATTGTRMIKLDEPSSSILGRTANLHIDDQSVSREHARLTVHARSAQPQLTLEDLGSKNGTFVSGSRLEPGDCRPLAIGETFQLGDAMLMVCLDERVPRPRRLLPHWCLEARLEEECARQSERREKRPAVFTRVALNEPSQEDAWLASARAHLRPFDILARRGPGHFDILMCETTLEEASALLESWVGQTGPCRFATAGFPRDGRSAFALIELAETRLRGKARLEERAAPRTLDPPMADLMRRLERAAASSSSVLFAGETGTGKSFLAERLHRLSKRAEGPFILCDCAAINAEIIDSELFGHARGAFTGALAARKGVIESADGGTLFLDEIGELPLEQQVKLLTVLDHKSVRRVGENKPVSVDFRLIAASNQDLRELVRKGRFREELFFRINVIRLHVPPLRDRPAEMELLAQQFLAAIAAEQGRPLSLAAETLDLLRRHPWPGNIRELRHAIESAAAQCASDVLLPEDFPLDPSVPLAGVFPTTPLPVDPTTLTRDQLMALLLAHGGNRTRAAESIGRSREWLRQKSVEFGIPLAR